MRSISWLSFMTGKSLKVMMTIAMVMFWTACSDDSSTLTGPDDAAAGKKGGTTVKTKVDVPTISCAGTSSKSSITILVTAGGSGAPAGFSLQWMTKADNDANGWPLNSDDACKASFSGNAKDSRYLLDPNEPVEITIGDITDDNGASSNCWDFLECGTEYVFRAFAHATSSLQRSDFSGNLVCATADCDGGCTYTQGYWKTHGPEGCNPSGGSNAWPLSVQENGLTLGTVSYNATELCSILNTPVGAGPSANGLIALAHQLIAAKLNLANGAVTNDDVAAMILTADGLIGDKVVPPVGSGMLKPGVTSSSVAALDGYNKGNHCE